MTPSPPAGQLVGLVGVAPGTVEQARAIYTASFPPAVRAPFRDLVEVRDDERTQLLLDAAGDVLGLVLVRDLGDTGWTFLRYFVVARSQRGQGVGGRLWSSLCRDLVARGRTRLLFDVEDPDDAAADADEADERRRRVRFYRRLGADVVEVATYAPPHHGEIGSAAIPLRLMGAELTPAGGSGPLQLDSPAAELLVATVMQRRYGVRPADGS